jgi:hypothetical protein
MKLSFSEWFRQTNPPPDEVKERWEKIGGVPVPLKVWMKICEEFDGIETWDTLIECARPIFSEDNKLLGEEPYLTPYQAEIVMLLDYYGKPIKKSNARILAGLKPWVEIVYSIVTRGIDGTSTEEFETIEHVRTHLKEWIGQVGCWVSSDTAYHNDYCHFYCHGFKLSDLGYKWQDHVA